MQLKAAMAAATASPPAHSPSLHSPPPSSKKVQAQQAPATAAAAPCSLTVRGTTHAFATCISPPGNTAQYSMTIHTSVMAKGASGSQLSVGLEAHTGGGYVGCARTCSCRFCCFFCCWR